MRYIKGLTKDTIKLLKRIYKDSKYYQVRQRSHCIMQIIKALKSLEDQGFLDLRYLDESGFCLMPYVPYGWQDTSGVEGFKANKSKRLNVIGLLNRNND